MIDEQSGTIVVLGAWEVLVCVVPPSASYRFRRKLKLPDKPTRPMSTYPTITGVDETVESLPDTKEYNVWLVEMEIWEAAVDKITTDNAIAGSEFAYDYALLAWRKVGSDTWLEEPPEDWELPAAYARHGVDVSDNRRLEFIMNVLLNTEARLVAVQKVMYPAKSGSERDTSPITREEVAAAVATFPAGDEVSGAARRMGTNSGERTGRKHTYVKSSSRTASGGSKRAGFGWLVRLFKRS